MGNEAITHAEGDEEILSFDIPDEALERAQTPNRPISLCSIALTIGIAATRRSKYPLRLLNGLRSNSGGLVILLAIRRRPPPRLILEIDIRERLSIVVAGTAFGAAHLRF
jgi:hypothetical protein